MSVADWVMDGALALALPLLAWRALASAQLSRAVVLFVAMGLLSAVAWGRLAAPDVALVEAAVGAGLTGALLMSALGWVAPGRSGALPLGFRLGLLTLLGALGVGLALVVLDLPEVGPGQRVEVLERLEASGVSHPVTAVLLNFRGYDTLLEIAVLLVAAVGVRSLIAHGAGAAGDSFTHPLFPVLVRMLVPGAVLVAGYLLWKGSHGTGGAFQAGAILGGAGILAMLTRAIDLPSLSAPAVRGGLLVGPLVFVAVATAPLLGGGHLLEYPRAWAAGLMLGIEAALTLSIALALMVFFKGVAR